MIQFVFHSDFEDDSTLAVFTCVISNVNELKSYLVGSKRVLLLTIRIACFY